MSEEIKAKLDAIRSSIKTERKAKDMSQGDIAIKLKIRQSTYSKIESGETPLQLYRMIQISEILDINYVHLIINV